jgi:hypothetical protein
MKSVAQHNSEGTLLLQRQEHLTWFSSLKQSWKAAMSLNLSQTTMVQAIPSTIGFLVPLTVGVATGHVLEGVALAGGAIGMGAVGLTFTYKARMRTMCLAAMAVAISAFVGAVTSPIAILAILALGIWGFGAGLLAGISQSGLIIGLQAVIALIILSHFTLSPLQSAIFAALFLTGGMFQIILALLFAPLYHTTSERELLATTFQKLADYATDQEEEDNGSQLRDTLIKTQTTLSDNNDQSQQGHIFMALLEEAEKMRLLLIVLRKLQSGLGERAWQKAEYGTCLDQIMQATAEELRQIAQELKSTNKTTSRTDTTDPYESMKSALSTLRKMQVSTPRDKELQQDILQYCDRLRDHLHRGNKLAKSWKYPQQPLSKRIKLPRLTPLHLRSTQVTLRDNLTLRSPAFAMPFVWESPWPWLPYSTTQFYCSQ